MFHCPYLLHKFVVNYLFDPRFDHYSLCLVYSSYPETALLEYLDLLRGGRGVCSSLPSGLLHLYDCDYEIYNIAHTAFILLVNPSNRTTRPTYAEKKMLHQLCSTRYAATWINNCLKKNFCNQSSHYENNGRFNASHHAGV